MACKTMTKPLVRLGLVVLLAMGCLLAPVYGTSLRGGNPTSTSTRRHAHIRASNHHNDQHQPRPQSSKAYQPPPCTAAQLDQIQQSEDTSREIDCPPDLRPELFQQCSLEMSNICVNEAPLFCYYEDQPRKTTAFIFFCGVQQHSSNDWLDSTRPSSRKISHETFIPVWPWPTEFGASTRLCSIYWNGTRRDRRRVSESIHHSSSSATETDGWGPSTNLHNQVSVPYYLESVTATKAFGSFGWEPIE